MAMENSSVRKLKPVLVTKDNLERERRDVVGHVIAVSQGGKAMFVDEAGEETEMVISRRIDRCWLKAAVALARSRTMSTHSWLTFCLEDRPHDPKDHIASQA
jgi:hypothetical protein